MPAGRLASASEHVEPATAAPVFETPRWICSRTTREPPRIYRTSQAMGEGVHRRPRFEYDLSGPRRTASRQDGVSPCGHRYGEAEPIGGRVDIEIVSLPNEAESRYARCAHYSTGGEQLPLLVGDPHSMSADCPCEPSYQFRRQQCASMLKRHVHVKRRSRSRHYSDYQRRGRVFHVKHGRAT